jgi:threonylcarbamoyladenosine tRNA methylthiotransferase MtaB
MGTFHLLNFGCRASQADGAALKRQLREAGFEEAARAEQSQITVLNTCTVTATADAEVRQMIRRLHRANPRCRILVTGCYAQRAPEELAQLPGVAWVVGNSHRHLIAEVLSHQQKSGVRSQKSEESGQDSLVQIEEPRPSAAARNALGDDSAREDGGGGRESEPQLLVGEVGEEFHFAPVFPDDCTRPTIKVQDGCNARCAFCIIPQVRGRSRSLAPEKAVEQVRELVQSGYQEVVLSGINLGSYGKDLEPRTPLLELLERILAETSLARLRLSSIEAMDISPQLIHLVAAELRLAQHFHVPLQSGCDRILRLMNRRYWAAQYAERIQAIHAQLPHGGIGADVMVGFPGETDADHQTSLHFIESLPFTYLHVFPYSARPGTPAAARPDQLNGRVIHERGREVRRIMAQKRQAFLEAQIGRTLSVLTLDDTYDNMRVALSSNYLKVVLPFSGLPPNTLLDVSVGRVDEGLLYAYQPPQNS